MQFNVTNCHTMRISRKKEPVLMDYYIDGQKLSLVTGLEIATDTVAFATSFFLFATRKTRVVANLRLGFALTDTK